MDLRELILQYLLKCELQNNLDKKNIEGVLYRPRTV